MFDCRQESLIKALGEILFNTFFSARDVLRLSLQDLE